jgi:muramoyltetrapeptide carboxypeptidase LdcA involved in peptidoglycan recycling
MTSAYLFAPAYPLDAAGLARTRAAVRPWAEDLGMTVVESPGLEQTAGPGAWRPAAERRQDLQRGLEHQVLLAVRGGYGCLDLLEDWTPPTRWPCLIGYSDLTVLHAVWGAESLYGYMPGVAHGPRAGTSCGARGRRSGVRAFGGAPATAPCSPPACGC